MNKTWLVTMLWLAAACNPQQLAEDAAGTRRISIATGGTGGVYYPYGGAMAKVISDAVPGVAATAEVTSASVDNVKFVHDGSADVAFTLADTLDDAVQGRGAFESTGPLPLRSLAMLYANYTHLVTLDSSGIRAIGDLRGRVVGTGAPGSGTEVIAFRVLEAEGVAPDADIRKHGLSVSASVDALRDGKIDAFFWSGGLPTAAVLDLANTPAARMLLVPNTSALPELQRRYGSLYFEATVPRGAYPGLAADVPVVGVANLLVVGASMPDDLAYAITKALFEHQEELARVHPQARSLALDTATVGSPAPFHPGAIRYYEERDAWQP